jgi:uncharacterized membrane protein
MPKIEIRDRTLRDIFTGQDSYILLFVLLIVNYLSLSLVDSVRWGGIIHIIPMAATVLLGLNTSGAKKRTIKIAAVILGLATVSALVQVFDQSHKAGGVAFFGLALLLVVTPLNILGRVLRHRYVNIETMFGAVDVYIMIGLLFATLFLGIATVSAHHGGGPFFAQSGPHPSSDYVYFSFIVLTTVGFGDLSPYTELARSVVVLEALMGQIFLVTLVARLVTLFGIDQPHADFLEEGRPQSELSPDPFTLSDDAPPPSEEPGPSKT